MFWCVGLTLPAAVVLVLLLLGPIPRAPWQKQVATVFDFGHFVLFAVVMLWLWVLLKRNVGLSLCISAAVAGILEAGQFFSGRMVCLPDFWRGLLGVLFTAVIIHACVTTRTFRQRSRYAILALALAAWPVAEVIPTVVKACGKFQSYCARDTAPLASGLRVRNQNRFRVQLLVWWCCHQITNFTAKPACEVSRV